MIEYHSFVHSFVLRSPELYLSPNLAPSLPLLSPRQSKPSSSLIRTAATPTPTPTSHRRRRRRRSPSHEVGQAQVLPGGLAGTLRGLLDAEGGVLVGHDVVLVLGVDGLVVRRHVDLVVREPVPAEVLEQVCVPRPLHVHVRVVAVLALLCR